MELKVGTSPYSDGSGFAAEVVVRQRDGDLEPQLRIEISYQIPISEWPDLRNTVDHLVEAAQKLSAKNPDQQQDQGSN